MKPTEEAVARREAKKIIRFGKVVYELFWDSGGPGAGAEYEYVFRWRDKYACRLSYAEPMGPFDDIRAAIREAWLDNITSATVHINSTELSSEEIAAVLRCDENEDAASMEFHINDGPWCFNTEGKAVRRAQV